MDIVKVVLTSLLSIVSIFVLTKLIGQRQVSQMTIFDYINGITVGSVAAELATEIENPIKPLISMLIFGVFGVAVNLITSKCPRVRRFINGDPIIIFEDGHFYRDNMRRAKLDIGDFLSQCRIAGIFDLSQLTSAVLEQNGAISFLISSKNRPATPSDLSVSVKKEELFRDLISDGQILRENLSRAGVDEAWVKKQLYLLGIRRVSDVFLARATTSGEFQAFTQKDSKKRKDR